MASAQAMKWMADFEAHHAPIKCVCIDSKSECFSSLDERTLRHWDIDGEISRLSHPNNQRNFYTNLLHVPSKNLYLAPALDMTLKAFDSKLQPLCSISTNRRAIVSLLWHEGRQELISGSVDGITCWKLSFKSGAAAYAAIDAAKAEIVKNNSVGSAHSSTRVSQRTSLHSPPTSPPQRSAQTPSLASPLHLDSSASSVSSPLLTSRLSKLQNDIQTDVLSPSRAHKPSAVTFAVMSPRAPIVGANVELLTTPHIAQTQLHREKRKMPILTERCSVDCDVRALSDNITTESSDSGWVQLMLLRIDKLGIDEIYAFCGHSLCVIDCQSGIVVDRSSKLHEGTIGCALFRGEFLITGSNDHTIKVWNTGRGQKRTLTHALLGHTDAVTSIVEHPEPSLFISSSLDCTVRVWNIDTFACIHRFEYEAPVLCVTVRPDRPVGALVQQTSSPTASETRDSPEKATVEIGQSQSPSSKTDQTLSQRASDNAPSLPTLATPSTSTSITRKAVDEWKSALTATLCVALASRVVRVFQLPCPSQRTVFAHVTAKARRLMRFPFSASYQQHLLSVHEKRVSLNTSSPPESVVLCLGEDSSVREINAAGGSIWAFVPSERAANLVDAVSDVVYSTTLRRLFVCSVAGEVFAYEIIPSDPANQRSERGLIEGSFTKEAVQLGAWSKTPILSMSRDKRRCLALVEVPFEPPLERGHRVVYTMSLAQAVAAHATVYNDRIAKHAVRHGGDSLVAACLDSQNAISNRDKLYSFDSRSSFIDRSTDTEWLATGTSEGHVVFCRASSVNGSSLLYFELHDAAVVALQFCCARRAECDQWLMISMCAKGTMRVWDFATMIVLHEINPLSKSSICCVDPLGQLLFGYDNGHMELIDPSTAKRARLRSELEHTTRIVAMDALVARNLLATASADGVIKFWSAQPLECKLTREVSMKEPIRSMCFLNEAGDVLIGLTNKITIVRGHDVKRSINHHAWLTHTSQNKQAIDFDDDWCDDQDDVRTDSANVKSDVVLDSSGNHVEHSEQFSDSEDASAIDVSASVDRQNDDNGPLDIDRLEQSTQQLRQQFVGLAQSDLNRPQNSHHLFTFDELSRAMPVDAPRKKQDSVNPTAVKQAITPKAQTPSRSGSAESTDGAAIRSPHTAFAQTDIHAPAAIAADYFHDSDYVLPVHVMETNDDIVHFLADEFTDVDGNTVQMSNQFGATRSQLQSTNLQPTYLQSTHLQSPKHNELPVKPKLKIKFPQAVDTETVVHRLENTVAQAASVLTDVSSYIHRAAEPIIPSSRSRMPDSLSIVPSSSTYSAHGAAALESALLQHDNVAISPSSTRAQRSMTSLARLGLMVASPLPQDTKVEPVLSPIERIKQLNNSSMLSAFLTSTSKSARRVEHANPPASVTPTSSTPTSSSAQLASPTITPRRHFFSHTANQMIASSPQSNMMLSARNLELSHRSSASASFVSPSSLASSPRPVPSVSSPAPLQSPAARQRTPVKASTVKLELAANAMTISGLIDEQTKSGVHIHRFAGL